MEVERGFSTRSNVRKPKALELTDTALHFTLLRVKNPRSVFAKSIR